MIPMLMDEEIWILTRQMKTSLPYKFLAAWMSVVCYLPPIYLFTDAHLLPKWYLCLIGLTVTGVLAAVTLWRGRRNGWNGETLSFVYKVYDATGDTLHLKEIAVKIATKRVKVNSLDVMRIKRRCR